MTRELLCPIVSETEGAIVHELQTQFNLRTPRDVARLAMWHLTRFAERPVGPDVWRLLDTYAQPERLTATPRAAARRRRQR